MEQFDFTVLLKDLWHLLKHLLYWGTGPLIIWAIWWRKENFFEWIGLKKISRGWQRSTVWIFIFLAISFFSQIFVVPHVLPTGIAAADHMAGMGIKALYSALLFGINTGFVEELFWRGFLGKRLVVKFGFAAGNLVQSLLFGLLHGVGFFWMLMVLRGHGALEISLLSITLKCILITSIVGFGGWILGYLTEKVAGGSIIPAFIAHALGNFLLAMAKAYEIL
jgi:uncharacterized protein